MKSLIYAISFVLLLTTVGCSADKSQVTAKVFAFTQDEENDLRTIAFESLPTSMQDEIVDQNQAEVSSFKSGSEFEVFNNETGKAEDIKDVQTITISFITKEESKSTSLPVYLNENGDKVLGVNAEDNNSK